MKEFFREVQIRIDHLLNQKRPRLEALKRELRIFLREPKTQEEIEEVKRREIISTENAKDPSNFTGFWR